MVVTGSDGWFSRRQHCSKVQAQETVFNELFQFSSLMKLPHPGASILFKVCQNSPVGAGNVNQSPHPMLYAS